MIPLTEPVLNGNESSYVQECISSGYVSSVGPFVEEFEKKFAEYVGSGHAVACATGTAALHVALRVAGATPGSLVAVSDFTFIASANAVSYTGADMLLVDSESRTWNMNTELLYDSVRFRARHGQRIPEIVLAVHILGHPIDMNPLLDLRDRFGIVIVEDAAESLGASWVSGRLAGSQVGVAGSFGCFSFNGNKVMTTGGGGMITSNQQELVARARHLTTQATMPGRSYEHDTIGYNYRLSNIAAALGVAQLERLSSVLDAKRKIANRYNEALSRIQLTRPPKAKWADPTYWLYSVLFDDDGMCPELVAAGLASAGIQTRRLWPPLHMQEPYKKTERIHGSVAEEIRRRGLSLPSSAHLSSAEQGKVIETLVDVLTRNG